MSYGGYGSKFMRYDTCPKCGGTKSKNAVACRTCHTGRPLVPTWKQCPGCGTNIRTAQVWCHDCYEKNREQKRPLCVDCGKPRTRQSRGRNVERCRDCWRKHLASLPVRLCSVDGCGRPYLARGLCNMHYIAARGRERKQFGTGHRGNRFAGLLAGAPCQVCGYNRMRSQLHKIERSLGYRPGNMVAVCSRCHDEIERGLTPLPPILTADEILALPE